MNEEDLYLKQLMGQISIQSRLYSVSEEFSPNKENLL